MNYIITGIFRLGMASREACITALNNCNWNVEEAASTLCDAVWTHRLLKEKVSSPISESLLFFPKGNVYYWIIQFVYYSLYILILSIPVIKVISILDS